MKSQYIAVFRTLAFIVTLIVGTSSFTGTQADDNFSGQIKPRIGLKSEAVVRNDLVQLGLSVNEIQLVGEIAKARIPVKGEVANIQIDRRTGTVRIIEAAPIARQLIESRIPKLQLLTMPKLAVPSK